MPKPFVQDDESLRYLTHEEKDVLLFFEETIDSLEDDFEEQVLCAGDAQWPTFYCSGFSSGFITVLSQPLIVGELAFLLMF